MTLPRTKCTFRIPRFDLQVRPFSFSICIVHTWPKIEVNGNRWGVSLSNWGKMRSDSLYHENPVVCSRELVMLHVTCYAAFFPVLLPPCLILFPIPLEELACMSTQGLYLGLGLRQCLLRIACYSTALYCMIPRFWILKGLLKFCTHCIFCYCVLMYMNA